MEAIEAMRYTTPADTADITAASPAAVSPFYALGGETVEAILAAIAGAAFIPFPATAMNGGRPTRALLTMAAVADNAETAPADLYLVLKSSLDGVEGVALLDLGQAVWTYGTVAVPNGRASHKLPSSVAFTSTGALESLVGLDIAAIAAGDGLKGVLAVPDVGPAIGLLAVAGKGTTDGVAPMHARWR